MSSSRTYVIKIVKQKIRTETQARELGLIIQNTETIHMNQEQ